MSIKYIFLFIAIALYPLDKVHAQRQAALADSLWCDHLNEMLKCASIDEITERIKEGVKNSSFIPAMVPDLRLTSETEEIIKKEYGKVSYECYLYNDSVLDKNLTDEFEWWYKKVKRCLYMWEEARLNNNDKDLDVPEDYFFTNSEDETSVRLDIVYDKGYHVRLRIF